MNEPNGDHFYASNILKCTAGVWTKRCYRRGRKLSTKTKKDKYQSAILMYETFRLELREKKSKSSHGFNPVGDSYTSLGKQ